MNARAVAVAPSMQMAADLIAGFTLLATCDWSAVGSAAGLAIAERPSLVSAILVPIGCLLFRTLPDMDLRTPAADEPAVSDRRPAHLTESDHPEAVIWPTAPERKRLADRHPRAGLAPRLPSRLGTRTCQSASPAGESQQEPDLDADDGTPPAGAQLGE